MPMVHEERWDDVHFHLARGGQYVFGQLGRFTYTPKILHGRVTKEPSLRGEQFTHHLIDADIRVVILRQPAEKTALDTVDL